MPLAAADRSHVSPLDRSLLATAVLGLVLWVSFAVWQGYDMNWDVLNYHLYNGFALLHGKVFSNLTPAMMQNYFAPLMDAAFYTLVRLLPATAVAVVIAAFQSLMVPIIFQLSRVSLSEEFGRGRGAIAFVLALLGTVAPVNLCEAGGAYGDTNSAVVVIAALLVTMSGMASNGGVLSPRMAIAAGSLAGCAAGLKLTNMSFALGLLVAVTVSHAVQVGSGAWTAGRQAIAATAAGMAAAFLLTYGWWGLLLYHHLGNPVFPNFNQVFRSPYAAPASYADPVFQVPGLWDKLLFPFARAPILGKFSSAGLFDLRMAFALPLCIVGLLAALCRSKISKDQTSGAQAAQLALMVFVPFSYVGWLLVFPVNRYLVALDMVAPLACVVAGLSLWRARAAAWAVVAALAVALPASTYVSQSAWWIPYWHRQGDGRGYFAVTFDQPPGLDGGTVVMLNDSPTAFVIPFFPRHTVFVRLEGSLWYFYPGFYWLNATSSAAERRAVFHNALGNEICHRLDENRAGLFLLRPAPDTPHDVAAMAYFGIAQAKGDCTEIKSKAGQYVELCPAIRVPSPECRG